MRCPTMNGPLCQQISRLYSWSHNAPVKQNRTSFESLTRTNQTKNSLTCYFNFVKLSWSQTSVYESCSCKSTPRYQNLCWVSCPGQEEIVVAVCADLYLCPSLCNASDVTFTFRSCRPIEKKVNRYSDKCSILKWEARV